MSDTHTLVVASENADTTTQLVAYHQNLHPTGTIRIKLIRTEILKQCFNSSSVKLQKENYVNP